MPRVPAPNPGPVAGPNIPRRLVRVIVARDGVTVDEAALEVEGRSPWTAAMRALRHYLKTRRRRMGRRTTVSFIVEPVR